MRWHNWKELVRKYLLEMIIQGKFVIVFEFKNKYSVTIFL
jgi:hypothetical protein